MVKFQAFQIGLWSVWLSGFLLIALSLYATHYLPTIRDQIKKPKLSYKGLQGSVGPNVTIFSAPRSFSGSVGAKQVLAVRSWLALSPDVKVVLFGLDPSVVSIAGALGSRVSVESRIDYTFLGSPFFHSMVARSQASTSDISVFIDPETVLLPDFMSTLHFAQKLDRDWLLVATSPNISQIPFFLDETGNYRLNENGKKFKVNKLQEFLARKQQWFNWCERILMAWNNGELPLHAGVLPPFLYGKGFHNQWMVNEALASDYRFVFDATGAISSFHPDDLGHWPNQILKRGNDTEEVNERSWEYLGNYLLAALYGSLYFGGTKFSNKLVKLVRCDGRFIFVDSRENAAHSHQDLGSSSLQKVQSRREKERTKCLDGSKLLDGAMDCSLELSEPSTPLSLEFSLESLLSVVADKDKTIVLAIAGNSYKEMLMSWACRLHQLSVSNFVVIALDDETYQFSILQGLPVFKDLMAPNNISFDDCHFGTKCFQRVTKVKSRLVLQILKMGYNVLLSDVDIYWFQDPLPHLRSFGPAVLVAQSDEYKEKGPINLPRRLNSGFYFAHSDDSTIAALEKVVKHAMTSTLSEQPSFYDVLCGEGGANRYGDDQCVEPETNVTVQFLDRDLFPNGAYLGLWEKSNIKATCKKKGCFIIHNNWINGRMKKLERQVSSGLWEYDICTRMCLQGWHRDRTKNSFMNISII